MRLDGYQKRRTIVVGEPVGHGVEGGGASNHVHTTRKLSSSGDLPTAVAVVDGVEGVMYAGRSSGRT